MQALNKRLFSKESLSFDKWSVSGLLKLANNWFVNTSAVINCVHQMNVLYRHNSRNTRLLKVQLARNFDQEREMQPNFGLYDVSWTWIIVFTVDICKFKGFTVKLWKKATFKPHKPLLPQPWKIAILRKCGWKLAIWQPWLLNLFRFILLFLLLSILLPWDTCSLSIILLVVLSLLNIQNLRKTTKILGL